MSFLILIVGFFLLVGALKLFFKGVGCLFSIVGIALSVMVVLFVLNAISNAVFWSGY